MGKRPIIFSGPMVRAILSGTKTATRRPIKPQPHRVSTHTERLRGLSGETTIITVPDGWRWRDLYGSDGGAHFTNNLASYCPYGKPGDTLWVRETHRFTTGSEDAPLQTVRYRADFCDSQALQAKQFKWRPSIFMPRWASRITLEVTRVRVERVQDITIDDLRREGVLTPEDERKCRASFTGAQFARDLWRGRWDAIYKKRFPFDSNPWVWIVDFARRGDG